MMNKKILFVIQFFLLSSCIVFPQYKITNLSNNGNSIKFDVELQKNEYSIEKNAFGNTIINFTNTMDESKPGTPELPYKIIFVALPSVSKVTVESSIISFERIDAYPQINPEVIQQNDSVITYLID